MHFLPAPLQPYARLMRLDKPTGWWLLLFPAWWSQLLATPHAARPDLRLMLLFLAGAIVMRGAGCAINDAIDHAIDAQVARTKNRPVACGEISPRRAVFFALFLALIGFGIVAQMGWLAMALGAASLPLILAYPWMKRFTWWPQAFLGLTFNWGALMGAAAVTGHIPMPALILYAACFFWTLGYDTIYAFQDIRDDEGAGVKSTARLAASAPRSWVGLCYGVFWLLLLAAGWLAQLGLGFYVGLAITLFAIAALLRAWQPASAASSLAMFRANTWLGWIVLLALAAKLV